MNRIPTLRRAGRFLRDLNRVARESKAHDSAATLTYTTLFAVVPMFTVVWAVMSSLPHFVGGLSAHFDQQLFANVMPAAVDQVRYYLEKFSQQTRNLTGIGVAFLVITALMMLRTIDTAINSIWRVHRRRGLLPSLLVYWALLSLGPVLIAVGLAASSWLLSASLLGNLVHTSGVLVTLLECVPFLVTATLLSLLYILVPNCPVPAREGIIGGVVTAALFELAKAGFGYFVQRVSSHELVYGAFATVPLFLLWIYISWLTVMFGVVLVYMLTNWDDEAASRGSAFPALLKVLALFHSRHQAGRSISDREVRHVARQAGIDNWHDWREKLLAQRYIDRLGNGELVLLRDMDAVKLSELLRLFSWEQLDVKPNAGGEPDDFAQEMALRLHEQLGRLDAGLDQPVTAVLHPGRRVAASS